MDNLSDATLAVTYRIFTILAGTVIVYLGYRLFVLGIFEKAGELSAKWQGKSLAIRQAAPGTFFALFGSVIICVSIWKGVNLSVTSNSDGSYSGQAAYSPRYYGDDDPLSNSTASPMTNGSRLATNNPSGVY